MHLLQIFWKPAIIMMASVTISSTLLPTNTFARQYEVSISPARKQLIVSPLQWGTDYIVMDESRPKMQLAFTFKLEKVKFDISLQRFDSNLQLLKENKLLNGEKAFGPFPSTIKQIGSRYCLIYSTFSAEEGLRFSLAGIDPATLQLDSAIELISVAQANLGLFKSQTFVNNSDLQITQSPNGSKLLAIWYNEKNRQFNIAVLDSTLTLKWKGNFTSSATDEMEEFTACVDDKGQAYVSYMFKTGKSEWIYKVGAYGAGRKLKEHEVRNNNGKVYQVVLIPTRSANLVHVIGSYSEHPGRLNGLFHQTLDTDNFVLKGNASYPFAPELVQQLADDNWASTKEKSYGLHDLRLQGFELSDGSLALAGQWSKTIDKSTTSTNSAGMIRTTNDVRFVSGSILNLLFRNNKLVAASIPKYRVSLNGTISTGFKAIPLDNKLYIFYNDEESNLKRDPLKKPVSSGKFKETSLAAAYMNDDGIIQREVVIGVLDQGFAAVGEYIQLTAPKKFVVPIFETKGVGAVGNESKVGVITMK